MGVKMTVTQNTGGISNPGVLSLFVQLSEEYP